MGANTIAQHEPAGIYLVDTTVLDPNGQGDLNTNFTVYPIIGLKIDFSTVDWGTIKANVVNWVSGDEDLTTFAKPTLKDCGNINMAIGLNFSAMLQQGVSGPKSITSFDAYLLGQTIDPITAGTPVWFNKCIIPCHPKELDLSIEPPSLLPAGTYAGTLQILSTVCTP